MLGRLRTASLVAALVAVGLASTSSGQSPGPGAGAPGGTPSAPPSAGAPPTLEAAIAAKERHAEELLDTPGVVGVGVGADAAGRPVVQVYTEKPDAGLVSSSLDGVPVERHVTGIIEARAPTDRFPRPVPIGVSSGLQEIATGTLGARVTDGTNVYALSNNHVFAGINTASVGDGIIQPGVADGGSDPADRIGTLAAYQTINFSGGNNTMDAAIALVTPATVGTATPPDGYGLPSSITAPAVVGQAVQKYGRTTGLQLGTVAATNVTVDVCYLLLFEFCLQEARFVGQVSVSPGAFSAPGDSGSLIVTQGTNQPVALLFAGGDGLTIGTPIDVVLQRFGVTIDGQPPGEGPPSAPSGLSAVAGDGSVSLSWTAPSFDGGSPISGYRVYRGQSPGGESFLESTTGPGTTFVDTTAGNGTTYYYKVAAENALGEGPLSNEASATPSDLVPPVEPLAVLDTFDRANEFPLSDAGRWSGAVGANGSAEGCLKIVSNELASNKTTTCTGWRTNAQYGPDVEVWARIAVLPGTNNHIRLKARLRELGTSGYDGYMLRTNQLAGADEIYLERIDNGAFVRLLTVNHDLAAGDLLLLRLSGSTMEAWLRNGGGWARLGTVSDSTYTGPGYVGVGLRGTTGRLDDFGARGANLSPPGAPTSLSAVAGDGSVSLTWTAPSFDGGSPLTGYRIYRGTSPGTETFLQSAPAATVFQDDMVENGTAYYYKVSAENAVGEGPLSNEASASPSGVVPPVEPLVILDRFNRANETPLSDSGRWANAVNGGVENGLHVSSSQLACSVTTTCTAWRSNAQYGADVEVSVRVAALPGTNNNIRLYARLKEQGSAAYDAYLLRTNQLAGTDEIYLERIDNGAHTRLATVSRDVVVGDTLLLRVEGTTVEGWRHDGTSWSRLATAGDTTYPAAGFVGIGLRGTTGRLDDFGGRTMGEVPPPPEPPGAPTSLTALASNGAVQLAWQPPAEDGGSAVSGYRIHRGTSPGAESFLQAVGTVTSYADTTVTNGLTYYYRVSAVNSAGEGPLSNEAQATPTDLVPPVTPLPTLDTFNRANELPLSDAGRWSGAVGVNGSAEGCLRVVSNQLASNKTTTCTSYRANTTYGPDTEVWTRVAVLPGSNNHIRLKARLQQPGTAGYDGYMLRTNQRSGSPDEVYLERIDNGVFVRLLTVDRELAVGNVLLLRVRGTTLEAWILAGSSWSRLGVVTDSTYPNAGDVGIGLRGKTGRLDDFGAR
jgi:fibronectin type 3 domain-containing protein